ncbi:MAG: hypothetical protein HYU69_09205 [Bacteroidetes bacterium]|nr:hypothetical protein [Bacteroidota bacterium]
MHKTITLKNVVKLNIKSSEPIHEAFAGREYEPSAMVINNILNYSKVLSVHKTNLLGAVDMVLN